MSWPGPPHRIAQLFRCCFAVFFAASAARRCKVLTQHPRRPVALDQAKPLLEKQLSELKHTEEAGLPFVAFLDATLRIPVLRRTIFLPVLSGGQFWTQSVSLLPWLKCDTCFPNASAHLDARSLWPVAWDAPTV